MAGTVPTNPAIFHITHVKNLPNILRDGCLWSDSERIRRGLTSTNIGYQHIKDRRLKRPVSVAAGGMLGDYVPFYFCSRSVMLYPISLGHADYAGGQEDVVHLVSSIRTVQGLQRPWAFTERHAELGYATYFEDVANLGAIDWTVMPLQYWADSEETKEKRQAEFLVHERFPWSGIERIGVMSSAVAAKVETLLGGKLPPVEIHADWYY